MVRRQLSASDAEVLIKNFSVVLVGIFGFQGSLCSGHTEGVGSCLVDRLVDQQKTHRQHVA